MISYYILRSGLTSYYVNDIIERLQGGPDQRGWDVGPLAPIVVAQLTRRFSRK